MWESNARTTLSSIIANLLHANPDCGSIARTVNNLAKEIGRQNRFKQVEPGDAPPMMNQKACETRAELENVETALREKDVPKALEHAKTALRVLN